MPTLLPPFLLVLPLGSFQSCPSISQRRIPQDSAPVFPAGPIHSWGPSSWDWHQGSGRPQKGDSNCFLLPSERLESVPSPCPGYPSKMDRSRVEGISDLFSCSILTVMGELAGTCEQSCPLVSSKGHADFSKKSLRVLKKCKLIKCWRECLFLSFLPLSPRLLRKRGRIQERRDRSKMRGVQDRQRELLICLIDMRQS